MHILNLFSRVVTVAIFIVGFFMTNHAMAQREISKEDYENVLVAVRQGDTAELVAMLKRGLDPDAVDQNGNTLLILAAREGNLSTVKALLEFRPRTGYRNPAGDDALMLATLRGHEAIVKLLLETKGVQINHEGWTALHYAAFGGHADLFDLLIDAGADVALLTPNKANVLMLAARNGHINIVRRLLKTDINLDQRTDQGIDAESWAQSSGNTDIAELIRNERLKRPGRQKEAPAQLRIEIE